MVHVENQNQPSYCNQFKMYAHPGVEHHGLEDFGNTQKQNMGYDLFNPPPNQIGSRQEHNQSIFAGVGPFEELLKNNKENIQP